MPHPIASDRLVVEQHGPVIAVRTNHDENRLHPDLLDQLEATLDRVDHADGPGSPVLTGAGKFFSNGPDLDYMSQKPEEAEKTLARVHALLGRMLGFRVRPSPPSTDMPSRRSDAPTHGR